MLRIFKADQQSRYLLANRDTTAREAANLVMKEFGLSASPEAFSLCEVSVTQEGVIKQRRLPDQLSKLADRIQLSARFGLKLNLRSQITILIFLLISSAAFFQVLSEEQHGN